ncbi:MAG: hypothetical protein N2513_05155 [Deltaproteobacteria bacterium]|nr:hypothetical protein [Deltaproteobacteria bacterium]
MLFKRYSVVCIIFIFFLVGCEKTKDINYLTKEQEKKIQEKYEKQIEELKKNIKTDIKIKLKRDGKGNYTWEIQGKDVNEVLRANEILRKRLSD